MGTFNEALFEKKLTQLRETHESISNLSNWCLENKAHHQKIVSIWLSVLKKVKVEHRLLMFYLANDVIQYGRRKHIPFPETFAPALQKATTMVREDSIKNKILRLFKIWDERCIYDEAFLLDLSGLLVCDPKSAPRIDTQNFQPLTMYSRIRSCKKLEDITDQKFQELGESKMPITDVEKWRKSLKEREQGEDLMEDVEKAVKKMKGYVNALESEIKERSVLIGLLEAGELYYEQECKEARMVLNAYKCFGQRVKQVQKKLDEKVAELPSPVPSPDVNAPSPPQSPGEETTDLSGADFTLGGSFINNSASLLEGTLDSQSSEVPTQAFYKNSPATTENYYIPPVYNPSMTTSEYKKVTPEPYVPEPSPLISSPNDIAYNPVTNNLREPARNDLEPDSEFGQSYTAEFFTGSASSDSLTSSKTNAVDAGENGSLIEPQPSLPQPILPKPLVLPDLDTSVFNSLMQQMGQSNIDKTLFSVPPPPPPPPLEKPEVISPKPDKEPQLQGNKIEVIGGNKTLSISDLLKSLMPKKEPPVPLKPPPMPPTVLQMDSEQKFSWEAGNEWESPQSPLYEENFSSPRTFDKSDIDTDMRKKDVDHRNLINLTGSWADKKEVDQLELPPPPKYTAAPTAAYSPQHTGSFPEYTPTPISVLKAEKMNMDNVENVDMEMSDEEERKEEELSGPFSGYIPSPVTLPPRPSAKFPPMNNVLVPPPPPPPREPSWLPPPPSYSPHPQFSRPPMFNHRQPQFFNRLRPPMRFNRPRFQHW